ncbi:class I SAM-dependent methyltransferase [Rhodococcus ruber]|uniref:class I SAM-dependent methyltransferase n=1 Tax=Rhodococcus ruber TaxID=1830 RepID=UPI00177E8E40|nr:methyltransferase domain-containing protein [Rhodococcus ruber]MBD8057171.1 class I SAM-dependent methyltransferase [Rhodococcus ruber]
MGWTEYLAGFHRDHAGVTAQVLGVSRDRLGHTPYEWLAAAAARGRVLDVACGNAPWWSPAVDRRYVGLDESLRELALAQRAGASSLLRASAVAIPVATSSVDVVTCSMALMILSPPPTVLSEIRRVLVPGGILVATVPATSPLRAGDTVVAAGLLAALGRPLRYPNDALLADLPRMLTRAGLELVADERRRFEYPLTTSAAADLLVSSLYLPALSATRYRAARAYLRTVARVGVEFPVPIRRIVAVAR